MSAGQVTSGISVRECQELAFIMAQYSLAPRPTYLLISCSKALSLLGSFIALSTPLFWQWRHCQASRIQVGCLWVTGSLLLINSCVTFYLSYLGRASCFHWYSKNLKPLACLGKRHHRSPFVRLWDCMTWCDLMLEESFLEYLGALWKLKETHWGKLGCCDARK